MIDYEFDMAGISSDATQNGPNITALNGEPDTAAVNPSLISEMARENKKFNR